MGCDIKIKAIYAGNFVCRYKGDRQYIHGTDVYNTFFKEVSASSLFSGEFKNVVISFKKMMTGKTVHYEVYDQKIRDENANALIEFVFNGMKYYALLKNGEERVEERYPFNDDNITKYCSIDLNNKKITLSEQVGFTSIEIVTAMNKKLLNSLFPSCRGWLMTKFESAEYHESQQYQTLEMRVVKSILLKLVKTNIYIDKILVGSVYFSESK